MGFRGKSGVDLLVGGTLIQANAGAIDARATAGLAVVGVAGSQPQFQYSGSGVTGSDGWVTLSGVTLTFSSADSPVYVCTTSADLTATIQVGNRVKLTHGAVVKYFIVVAIAAGTITLLAPSGQAALSATAITLPFYSSAYLPYGFIGDVASWTIETSDASSRSQANPTAGTWYNLGSLSIVIPIGIWDTDYQIILSGNDSAVVQSTVRSTLSTGATTESDIEFSSVWQFLGVGTANPSFAVYKRKQLTLAAKTTYYLNGRMNSGLTPTYVAFEGALATTKIRARSIYV